MKHTMLHCDNKWVDREAESCSGKPYKGSCSSCHGIPAGAVLIAAHMLSQTYNSTEETISRLFYRESKGLNRT